MTWTKKKLGRDVPFLGALGVLESLGGLLEISAGVLTVAVEEERVEPIIQIVMSLDILLCAGQAIRGRKATRELAQVQGEREGHASAIAARVPHQKCNQVVDRALLDDEPPVNEQLAQLHVRVPEEGQFGGAVRKPDHHLGLLAIAEREPLSLSRNHLEGAGFHIGRENCFEETMHHSRSC